MLEKWEWEWLARTAWRGATIDLLKIPHVGNRMTDVASAGTASSSPKKYLRTPWPTFRAAEGGQLAGCRDWGQFGLCLINFHGSNRLCREQGDVTFRNLAARGGRGSVRLTLQVRATFLGLYV